MSRFEKTERNEFCALLFKLFLLLLIGRQYAKATVQVIGRQPNEPVWNVRRSVRECVCLKRPFIYFGSSHPSEASASISINNRKTNSQLAMIAFQQF